MADRIVLAAAENGLIPGLKVGGIADVIAGLAPALASQGKDVTIVTPSYGLHDALPHCAFQESVSSNFGGHEVTGHLYTTGQDSAVTSLAMDIKGPNGGAMGEIYIDDGADAPFASDANRFALFSSLVASYLNKQDDVTLVHLHDWHLAPLLLLRSFSAEHQHLKTMPFVYTIHNLAFQGIRPLRDHSSSLFHWFPGVSIDSRVLDPRWQDCINLMRTGINLADSVNTVSPGYAKEILLENNLTSGFHGGEGLEQDLHEIAHSGRLSGILNGCDYPARIPGRAHRLTTLMKVCRESIYAMMSRDTHVRSNHLIALDKIESIRNRRRQTIVTSIGRLTGQKVGLFRQVQGGRSTLDLLLDTMGEHGILILLGTGDPEYERFFNEAMHKHNNLLFIAGFDAALADDLYKSGHLFLMPSSFEPCGISQMLAMRAGQPCLVHAVGGLKDTITPETGWLFEGNTPEEQDTQFSEVFATAFGAAVSRSNTWQLMREKAQQARFTWSLSATSYLEGVYRDALTAHSSGRNLS